jgi:hypothetical protein
MQQLSYLLLFQQHVLPHVQKLPHHLHVRVHAMFYWMLFLLGFVFKFLITFSLCRLNDSVYNASPCLNPTVVSKLGDILYWLFTFLLVFSSVILTSLTNLVSQTLS